MRKIETLMNQAIQNSTNWCQANTQVVSESTGVSYVYLHGNKIAEIGEDYMTLFDGGWQSNTTKSRLNALLSAFGINGERVFQKDFTWYLQMEGGPVPFFSGMRLN